jgi:hypothetical protein
MMTRLIDEIKNALAEASPAKDLLDILKSSDFIFKQNYPIALIHSASRLDNTADLKLFKEHKLLDEDGHTPIQPSSEQLEFLAHKKPQYLKSVSIMCLQQEPEEPLKFSVKRPHDYWKKIQDVNHIQAMVEISHCDDRTDLCAAEFTLREIIRKRKEVHALKEVSFIWIAVCPIEVTELSELFKHYFNDNHAIVKTDMHSYHLGWDEALRNISMRDFVCPPE